ncbi:carboxypeptidase regulatory-like domain-containing protein [bacterium]|nr:MAG: carboxypeptidase regulatory-like domain-containing protein [bacterium]
MKTHRFIVLGCGLLFSLALILFTGCDSDDSDSNGENNTTPQTCTLSGRATFAADGNPAGNVQVLLWIGDVIHAEMFTNSNGEYSFPNLSFGEYTIHFDSQFMDHISATLTLNTSDYTYNVQIVEKFPKILEAHGSIATPGGIAHYQFYDVRVWDAVGISEVKAYIADYFGENFMNIILHDTDQDGDYEGDHLNTEGVNYHYTYKIIVTDSDGNRAEGFYTFE